MECINGVIIFFFKQKTAYEILTCDWSSDVCSSDLTKSPQRPNYAGKYHIAKLCGYIPTPKLCQYILLGTYHFALLLHLLHQTIPSILILL